MSRGELGWMEQKKGKRGKQEATEVEKNDQMRVGMDESEKW